MDYKFLQEKFSELWKDCYGEQEIAFYVPTDEHSSGFNKIKLYYFKYGNEYNITEENNYDEDYYSFEYIINKYPKITLDREYAFYGKFVSWEDIESAFKDEKEIDLVRL